MASASQARRHRRMAARNRKPLAPIERKKLRTAVLRRVEPGDTLQSVADRLHQPKARIVEAISHDLDAIGEMFGEGETIDGIESRAADARLGWSRPFIQLARRVVFGFKPKTRPVRSSKYERSVQPTPRPVTTKHVASLEGMRLPIEHEEWLSNLLEVV